MSDRQYRGFNGIDRITPCYILKMPSEPACMCVFVYVLSMKTLNAASESILESLSWMAWKVPS